MTAVATGPDGLLAVGTWTLNGVSTIGVWTSDDGSAWRFQPIDALSTTVANTVSAVTALAHDGSAWWLGGRLGTEPVLARSTDRTAWYRWTRRATARHRHRCASP